MIKIENLIKEYKSKRQNTVALNNVNLNLGDSGMVFILGKSGCGKTTLLNMLGAVDRFSGGEITVDGRKLSQMSERERDAYRNSYVGFVFQEYNLIEDFNVEDNISIAQQLQRKEPSQEEIAAILDKLDLQGLQKRKISELSGGQRQRVAIARALIKDPKLILADEPTGALDSGSGESLMSLLKEISKDRLVVVVSHDRDFAELFGDRIVELKDGEVFKDSADFVPTQEKPPLPLTYAKIKTGQAVTIGLKTVLKKPVRFILSVLLLTITVCLMSMSCTISAFNYDMAVKRTIYNVGREYTVATGKYVTGKTNVPSNGNYDLTGIPFDDNHLSNYSALTKTPALGFMRVNKFFGNNVYNLPNGLYGQLAFEACTAITQEAVDDFGFDLIGDIPQANNQIVIPKYALRKIKEYGYTDGESKCEITCDQDIIGKRFLLDGVGGTEEYIISGVIVNADIDESRINKALRAAKDQYCIDNIKNERDFYEWYYPCSAYFVSPAQFENIKANTNNAFIETGLLKEGVDFESRYNKPSDIFLYKNNSNISLDILVHGSDSYSKSVVKQVLFNGDIQDGQCVLGLFDLFIYLDEYDVALDEKDAVDTGCSTLYEYINKNFFNVDKIRQLIQSDYGYLIDDYYSLDDRTYYVYEALRNNSYDVYGIPFAQDLYGDIAELLCKYACGITVKTGGYRAKCKDFKVGGIAFLKDNGDCLAITKTDAEEITYGAVENYYDYLLAIMPQNKNDVFALYDEGLSPLVGLRFALGNFEGEAVEDFQLQLSIAKSLSAILCGVLAVFSVILFFNFISSSISFRAKDIKILKNLGAGNLEIGKIFFAESLLSTLISFVLGIAFTFALIFVFNAYYASIIYPALVALAFEWFVPIALLFGSLIITTAVFVTALKIKLK